MKWISRTFLRGLATVLPIALSIAFVVWAYTHTEALLSGLAETLTPGVPYVPGLGIAIALVLVFAAGVLMRVVLARRLVAAIEARVMAIPLLKTIYGALKDLLGFFAEDGMRRKLSRVVEVRVADLGQTVLGFVTSERPAALPAGDPRIAVYVPMSYQIGGFTLFVAPEDVTELAPLSHHDRPAPVRTLHIGLGTRSPVPEALNDWIKAPLAPPEPSEARSLGRAPRGL